MLCRGRRGERRWGRGRRTGQGLMSRTQDAVVADSWLYHREWRDGNVAGDVTTTRGDGETGQTRRGNTIQMRWDGQEKWMVMMKLKMEMEMEMKTWRWLLVVAVAVDAWIFVVVEKLRPGSLIISSARVMWSRSLYRWRSKEWMEMDK